MASSIKETPVLRGKDARRFEERLKAVKPASKEEISRINKSYAIFKKIATFPV
ncbi:hypothetical protein M2138_000093 [Dysgonomonadaceae bacterium PH5-43]|nr:hypothetical protein [Dysgonomonadaceae bacterium PH5-43]